MADRPRRSFARTGAVLVSAKDVWHGRLFCQYFWIDARLASLNGRWIASVDTPDGPSLGWARTALAAMIVALAPSEGLITDLLNSAPNDLIRLFG